jgi:hypothetical protein
MRQTRAGEAKRERCRRIDQRYQPGIGLGSAQLMEHRLDILIRGGQPWKIVTGDRIALPQVRKLVQRAGASYSVDCTLTKLYFALNIIRGALPEEPSSFTRQP